MTQGSIPGWGTKILQAMSHIPPKIIIIIKQQGLIVQHRDYRYCFIISINGV